MSPDDVRVSPDLIAQLNKLATYLTEQGEYEACDLIDTVVERVTKPALPPQGDGLAELRALSEAYKGGDIVGFRTRFRTEEDQDQTLMNASGEELATTYNVDTARFIAAAVNHVRAELERTKGGG